jgi:oligopeptidase A
MLFSKNLIDSKKEWSYTLTPEVKVTLSEKDLESFKEIDGELVMKFNQNAMGDIMVKSPSDELKQIIYEASGYPGSPRSNFDNTEVTKNILSLKQQIAAIMGYKSYTEMALEDRMAPTYDVVTNFLGRIKEKMQPLAKVEYEALNQFAKNEFGVDTIPKWNRGFYGNIKKEKLLNYEFNMERPYFNKDRVFEGVFNLVEKLFGFTFVKDTEAFDLPYEDSECFKVYEGDVLKARLIVDMYERELKGSGAWVSCLSGVTLDEVGLVSLCCNINKKDIGMDIDEIVTFLHEMGHAVHHFSSKVQYSDMAGTSGMARDAVEIPSQMLEQFAYDPEFLMSVSGHVETGEKIPQVMLNSIIASKNYNVGSMYARQLVLATFDINLYNTFEGDITDFYKSIANEILPSKVDDDTSFPNTFGHIFAGGYSAGYYGYMWADIYSVDAFMHVIEDKEKNAIKFKKEFLEKGSSVEPLKLYDNFRGQEVSIDNFLSYYGVS